LKNFFKFKQIQLSSEVRVYCIFKTGSDIKPHPNFKFQRSLGTFVFNLNRKTEKQKDIKTERQIDRETERQKDRKTERQKDKKTKRHKDIKT
jgi:hypothetical protein